MGSLTKGQRKWEEQIKKLIMDGKKRGVCDGEGRSLKTANGVFVAKPRGGVHRKIV